MRAFEFSLIQQRIAEVREQGGYALTYLVVEKKRAPEPWQLTVHYLVVDESGREFRAKRALMWYRTQEQAEAVGEKLALREDAVG